ncbi:unnamed protein product [Ophioblennius macclurei]
MALPTKQYGLILPQKKGGAKSAMLQKPSVFGDDSDDETTVGESLQREAIKKKMMKQTRLEMQKALEQDSTVYDYDSVYDDIQQKRLENNKKVLGGTDKRPKYIQQLMKAVDDRKKEQERREERKIQKEREAEGEQFADKEAYVTSAYKQKLLEQKEEQERENREAAIEAALDVRKQQDLSGFYRHFLNQTVGEEAIPDRSANPALKIPKEEPKSPVPSPPSRDNVPSSGSDNEEDEEEPEQKTGFSKPGGVSAHSKRQYRQRSPSSDSGDEKERERERDRHKKSHRDRDRGRDRDRDRERERDKNRGRERDDRHGERRGDRDRRRDRDRDDRDDRDRTREERHGKRERSREREKNGEKRRNSDEDRRKDRNQERAAKADGDKKDAAAAAEGKGDGEKKEEDAANDDVSKFAKRNTDQTVTSARERYMARRMARSASKSYVEKEED